MDPTKLRDLLAVLRDAGVAQARIPVTAEGHLLEVTLGPVFSSPAPAAAETPSPEDTDEDNNLPPGAFDPVARRRAAKGQ